MKRFQVAIPRSGTMRRRGVTSVSARSPRRSNGLSVFSPITLMSLSVARQSKPLVQRQSGIHPMVEQRSVGKLVSSPKPPEAGAQRARLYTSLTAGHDNSRMQLTLDDTHSRQ